MNTSGTSAGTAKTPQVAEGVSPQARPEGGRPESVASYQRGQGHTPGPWSWFGNANSNSLYLATTHSGRRYVMGFKRWGFSGAQPQFQPEGRGLVDASTLLQFEVGDRDVVGVEAARQNTSVYRMDVRGIDCADARLIAAAPELLELLLGLADILEHDCGCPPCVGSMAPAEDLLGRTRALSKALSLADAGKGVGRG